MPDTILPLSLPLNPPSSRIVGEATLDPQVSALLQAVCWAGLETPDPLVLPLPEVRRAAERFHGFLNGHPLAIATDDVQIPGPAGPVSLRLFRPPGLAADAPLAPVLLYFHGGGFVVNSVRTHDRLLRLLALRSRAVVVAVDYAKAPEHRFPHQYVEALAALRWIHRSGYAYGLDAARVAVGGDSAGANLALGAALAARDGEGPKVSVAVLLYGMFAHDFDTLSHRRLGDGRFGLSTERMRWYWRQYLGHDGPTGDPRAVPLLADLRGLPPVLLLGAGLDCLRDDTVQLAGRLAEAGVTHSMAIYDGLPHAFANMTRLVDAADGAVTRAALAVRRHLGA